MPQFSLVGRRELLDAAKALSSENDQMLSKLQSARRPLRMRQRGFSGVFAGNSKGQSLPCAQIGYFRQ